VRRVLTSSVWGGVPQERSDGVVAVKVAEVVHEGVANLLGAVDILPDDAMSPISSVGYMDWAFKTVYGRITLSVVGF